MIILIMRFHLTINNKKNKQMNQITEIQKIWWWSTYKFTNTS